MSCTISESVTLSSFFISFRKFGPFCVLGELTEVAELIKFFFEPIHLNIKGLQGFYSSPANPPHFLLSVQFYASYCL